MRRGFSPIVIVVIVGLIVVAGSAYFMRSRSTSPGPSSTERTSSPQPEAREDTSTLSDIKSTLSGVIGRGQNLECDWKIPVESAENPFNTGKLWTTGNLGRSTISGNVNGMSMEGNAVYKNNEVYSWMTLPGAGKMGFKFTQSELKEMDSSMTQQERQQAEQIRQEMIFNCRPWTPDNSKFELPSDVEFKSQS